MDEIDLHNRSVMLQRIRLYWLKGVLEESLHGAELIDLGLAYRPGAVANGDPDWEQTAAYDIPLPVGTRISDVFHAADYQLLIMGEPGAGKTTMLLSLVEDLLQHAQTDLQRPIPVVFNLATWTAGLPLDAWMIGELSNNYEVPNALGRFWLEDDQLLPLLDGLDEVEQDHRLACAEAINVFRQRHTGPILVTSRSQDYRALNTRLQLDKAIVLQPLTLEQIDQYLGSRGARLAGLRAALHSDASLRELAQSPLMLSIMTLAYYRMPEDAAIALGSRNQSRDFLFDVYVERMTRYRSGERTYDPDTAVGWLAWIAARMAEHNRTMLFLENIQPNWLPRPLQRRFADGLKFLTGLLLVLAGVVAGLCGVPAYGWSAPLVGAGIGLLAAFYTALVGRILLRSKANWYQIETTETIGWSWQWAWLALGVGGLLGLLAGAGPTFLAARGDGAVIPWWLLLPVWLTAVFILEKAIMRSEVKLRTRPGQGIEQSRSNGLRVGVGTAVGVALGAALALGIGALAGAAVPWLQTLPWIVGGALFLGLAGGLSFGGLAYLKHCRLLALLARENALPHDPVQLLDYAAERNLLRKVGGGFTFAHALLLDYFRRRGGYTAYD